MYGRAHSILAFACLILAQPDLPRRTAFACLWKIRYKKHHRQTTFSPRQLRPLWASGATCFFHLNCTVSQRLLTKILVECHAARGPSSIFKKRQEDGSLWYNVEKDSPNFKHNYASHSSSYTRASDAIFQAPLCVAQIGPLRTGRSDDCREAISLGRNRSIAMSTASDPAGCAFWTCCPH